MAAFSFATVDMSQDGAALFNPNSRHLARDGLGRIYVSYQYSSVMPAYNANVSRITWYPSGSPETAPGQLLWTGTIPSNAPCIAATSDGQLWAAYGDPFNNMAYILKWANPAVSTTPQVFSFPMDMGGNTKHTCIWSESERRFTFVSSHCAILALNEDGSVFLSRPSIFTPVANRDPQYPNIDLDPNDGGNLGIGWTVVDQSQGGIGQYHFVGYLESHDQGLDWSGNGNAPYSVTPSQNVVPDETSWGTPGAPLQVTWHGAETRAQSWLSSMIMFGPNVHFGFLHTPGYGELWRAMGEDNPRATTFYYAFNRQTGAQVAAQTPMRGDKEFPHASSSMNFAIRNGKLYAVAAHGSQIDALVLGDDMQWHDVVSAQIPGTQGNCLLTSVGDRGWHADPDIIGALSIWQGSAASWDIKTDYSGPTQVVFWRLTLP